MHVVVSVVNFLVKNAKNLITKPTSNGTIPLSERKSKHLTLFLDLFNDFQKYCYVNEILWNLLIAMQIFGAI